MPLTGAASTALDQRVIRPAWFGFLDFVGDPVRATTWRAPVSFAGTGDPDLDGKTFTAIEHEMVKIGDISQGEGGSDTLEIALSGLISIDAALMTIIGNRSDWVGRVARLWLGVYDESGVAIGAVAPFYTGYMTGSRFVANIDEAKIVMAIENYLAALSEASNRTYLDQAEFDAGDQMAKAMLEIANGVSGNPLTSNVGGGGGGGRAERGPWTNHYTKLVHK